MMKHPCPPFELVRYLPIGASSKQSWIPEEPFATDWSIIPPCDSVGHNDGTCRQYKRC